MVKCGGKKSTEYALLKWSYFYNSNWEFVLYSGWDIFVSYISVSTVISSGGSGHISAPHAQAAALAGDETSVISSIFYFSFWFFLDRSDAIVKSLQVGSNLSGHPALPWEADPETGSIPSGNFSWSSGSNHWFCLASCLFSSYSSKFSFSKYFVMSMTEIYSNLKAMCRNTAALLCCENLPWTSHRWKVSRVPIHIRWQLF